MLAAKVNGLSVTTLRELADDNPPRVRWLERRRHGRGESIVFDADELAEDLARLPRCRAHGCDERAAARSGYCGRHFGDAGREGAALLESQLLASAERDWYTLSEAIRESEQPTWRVELAVRTRELRSEKVGRHRRIRKADMKRWKATQPRREQQRKTTPAERDARRQVVRVLAARDVPPAEIARELHCSNNTILGDMDALGLPRKGRGGRARKLRPHEQSERQRRAAALYVDGNSYAETARLNESSATQVARDLRELGVEPRPQRRPAKHPTPSPRQCGYCGETFAPRFPVFGEQRFCSPEHWRLARAAAIRDELDERGLWSTWRLADRWKVVHRVVLNEIARGRLRAEKIAVPGALRPVWGVCDEERARYERERRRHGDGRRIFWLDPERVVDRERRTGRLAKLAAEKGISVDDAAQIIRSRVKGRRALFYGRRGGRKPAGGPPDYHRRWLERFMEIAADLEATHTERVELGEDLDGWEPSEMNAFRQLAQEDWEEHEDRWPRDRYPASPSAYGGLHPDFIATAAKRVRKAVKALQNAYTETAAA